LRPLGREAAVLVRLHLRAGAAAGAQSAVANASAAQRRTATDFAGQPDRRNLSISAGAGSPLPAARSQGPAGPGAAAAVSRRAPGRGGNEVIGGGGKTKTFELEVDFNKLIAYGLTLPQLLQALNNSNINVGGNTVNIGPQAAVVRGVGLIRTAEELSNTMLTQSGGNPVLVRDVASVQGSNKPRLGIAGQDADDDIIQGIVLMRRGEQSMPTIKRVEREVERINNSNILPPGVRIERIYDRKDLIDITTRTVLHNMAFGILLIFALQWIFLGNLRSALIVATT